MKLEYALRQANLLYGELRTLRNQLLRGATVEDIRGTLDDAEEHAVALLTELAGSAPHKGGHRPANR